MQKPKSLQIARMARDLQRLKSEAEKADLQLLAHLIDMAIIEARNQQK